jgi:(S)-2-hydroxyglutarate dehydrogenase
VSGTDPIVVIGGGIVGLASALALAKRSDPPLIVLEKEAEVSVHQTGHNSGVIHSGIYYRPGSLKARLCVEGRKRLLEFCEAHQIPYEACGKLIVATREAERPRLAELERRAAANGIPGVRRLSAAEVREVEPNVQGLEGLHVPGTGIVDYRAVSRGYAEEITSRGGEIRTRTAVTGLHRDGARLLVETTSGGIQARTVVNCAGLYSDRVARWSGIDPPARIVPFRGEYYFLRPERRSIVRGLVYPVPDPELPFLGVHFTRTIHGEVEAGPNAVPALAREGYTWTDFRWRDVAETMTYRGTPSALWRYGSIELSEVHRSLSRAAFVRDLQRLVPSLTEDDLVPGGSGVRAQAVSADGKLVDDFLIAGSPGVVHVLNAPSPAATASLAIGEYVCDVVHERFPDVVRAAA